MDDRAGSRRTWRQSRGDDSDSRSGVQPFSRWHSARAFTTDGKALFEFATAKEFQTVNEIPARGGAFGQSGSTVVNGMLFIGSGYNGQGTGGNVLLAFGLE